MPAKSSKKPAAKMWAYSVGAFIDRDPTICKFKVKTFCKGFAILPNGDKIPVSDRTIDGVCLTMSSLDDALQVYRNSLRERADAHLAALSRLTTHLIHVSPGMEIETREP